VTVVDWFNRLTQKNMFSVRNMYPFWFITWDDFPLRNCCSESAHVRNGERPWNMGTAQNYIMGYPLWIGGVNSSFNGTSFLWIFHSPVWLPEGTTQKTGLLNIQHDRSCVHWCLPFSSLAIDWIARTLGVPGPKKPQLPKMPMGLATNITASCLTGRLQLKNVHKARPGLHGTSI
jgi:hypothetical protein